MHRTSGSQRAGARWRRSKAKRCTSPDAGQRATAYQAHSLPAAAPPRPRAPSPTTSAALPALPALDPRVAPLARQWVAASDRPAHGAAHAARANSCSRATATRSSCPARSADPLADFLFERKEGHCEHFATALTVMLRTPGLPRAGGGGLLRRRAGRRAATSCAPATPTPGSQVFDRRARGWVALDATPDDGRGAGADAAARAGSPTRYEQPRGALARARRRLLAHRPGAVRARAWCARRRARRGELVAAAAAEARAWLAAALAAAHRVRRSWRAGLTGRGRRARTPPSGFLGAHRRPPARAPASPRRTGEPLEELSPRLAAAHHPLAPAARAASPALPRGPLRRPRRSRPSERARLLAALTVARRTG